MDRLGANTALDNAAKLARQVHEIDDLSSVTVTKMGHLIEIKHVSKRNTAATHVRLGADIYGVPLSVKERIAMGDLTTEEIQALGYIKYGGYILKEIAEYNHTEHRGQNINGVRRTMRNLRYLINNNFFGHRNELFVTLTYKENMRDTDRLYKDFSLFIKRLQYYVKKEHQDELKYLAIVEPQARGAFHFHVLLKFKNHKKSLFIPTEQLDKLWPHGFTNVKKLKNIDNLGAYLVTYLTDVELPPDQQNLEGENVVEKIVDGQKKKFLKGARLYLYPTNLNIYRCSRDVVMPERKSMAYYCAQQIIGDAPCVYSKKTKFEIDDFENEVTTNVYNKKLI